MADDNLALRQRDLAFSMRSLERLPIHSGVGLTRRIRAMGQAADNTSALPAAVRSALIAGSQSRSEDPHGTFERGRERFPRRVFATW
jgi:hypothetical protein